MYNDLFERVIGDAPPSTVDIEALVCGQRRAARRRIAGTVAAVVATTGLLTAGALTVGRPASGGHTPPLGVPVASATAPAESVTLSPTPAQTAYPPFVGPPVTEPSPAARQRLEAAMRHAVLAVAPAASFRTGNGASGFDMRHVDQPIAGTPPGNIPSFTYEGWTVVQVAGRQGTLRILVARAGPFREGCGGVPGVATCEPVTGPRGETGFLMSQVLDPSDRLEAQYHLWLDRSGVDAGTVTLDLMVDAPAGAQPESPLTGDDLIHIAEDPALTLYP
jgi:hypothetical protein